MKLSKISYIIVHRQTSPDRRKNLQTLINYLSTYFNDLEIIVIEQDVKKKTKDLPKKVKHFLIPDAGPFNKGKCFNIGMQLTKNPYLAFSDNDVIVPPQQLLESFHAIHEIDSIFPFTAMMDLSESTTKYFRKNLLLSPHDNLISSSFRRCLGAGLVLIQRKANQKIGGWCEEFSGWGWDDLYFGIKIQKLLHYTVFPSLGLHLFHSRSKSDGSTNPTYQKNEAIFARLRSYSGEKLKEHCKQSLDKIQKRNIRVLNETNSIILSS